MELKQLNPEEIIEKKYKKATLRQLYAVVLGGTLCLGTLGYSGIRPKPVITPAVQEYHDAIETLSNLQVEEQLTKIRYPYIPKDLEEDLSDLLRPRRGGENKLERAISKVEKNIKEIEESKEITDYNEAVLKYNRDGVKLDIFGVGVFLLSVASNLLYDSRARKRRDRDLARLEQ